MLDFHAEDALECRAFADRLNAMADLPDPAASRHLNDDPHLRTCGRCRRQAEVWADICDALLEVQPTPGGGFLPESRSTHPQSLVGFGYRSSSGGFLPESRSTHPQSLGGFGYRSSSGGFLPESRSTHPQSLGGTAYRSSGGVSPPGRRRNLNRSAARRHAATGAVAAALLVGLFVSHSHRPSANRPVQTHPSPPVTDWPPQPIVHRNVDNLAGLHPALGTAPIVALRRTLQPLLTIASNGDFTWATPQRWHDLDWPAPPPRIDASILPAV